MKLYGILIILIFILYVSNKKYNSYKMKCIALDKR